MINGILLIDKPIGISSQKILYSIKKVLRGEKIGHTGTLDLEASGLLIAVIGKATRVSDFLLGKDKTYITEIVLGSQTDTYDYSGKVINTSDKKIDEQDFSNILNEFLGEISQIPPMYSAIKVNGKKLYEIALEGKTINRKERKVKIYSADLLDYNFPNATLKIHCSKGTYIRSLANDIGIRLKTYAYTKSIRRIKVGNFDIKDAYTKDELLEFDYDKLKKAVMPTDSALKGLEVYKFNTKYFKSLINGEKIKLTKNDHNDTLHRVYCEDHFIGIGQKVKINGNYYMKMLKVLYEK